MIFCFVRETKQLTLEELDRKFEPSHYSLSPLWQTTDITSSSEVFSVPTREFLAYETKTWLPYFIKRHILRKKIAKPPPIIAKEDKSESDYSN